MDPPAGVALPAVSPPAPRTATDGDAASPGRITVTLVNPQPLYECRREDGSVYESATGVPERRWLPLWVIGRDARAGSPARSTVGMPRHRLPVVDGGAAYGAGSWVEDVCFQLPQAEVCARRRDRLTDLDHKRRLAFPSDRVSLDLQHRGLREQLQRECVFNNDAARSRSEDPPSTAMHSPSRSWTQEAQEAIVDATSSGSPTRRMGVRSMTSS